LHGSRGDNIATSCNAPVDACCLLLLLFLLLLLLLLLLFTTWF
jgi:hypothetical protein